MTVLTLRIQPWIRHPEFAVADLAELDVPRDSSPKGGAEDGRYPFVRLIEATGTPYQARESFLQQLSSQLIDYQQITKPPALPAANRGVQLTIDDFRRKATYGGDGNRIDLAYAIYALSHGVGETDVRAAIASRDLSKKGSEHRQAQYIERTIRKACSTFGR